MGKGAETNAGAVVEDGKYSSARDNFARNQPALPVSVALDAPLLLLRRRTWISVACELLRASVKHARHLAEDFCFSSSGGAGAISIADGDGGCGEYGKRWKGVVTVAITNRERWGGSTDGIADTSGSNSGRETSKISTACANDVSRTGSTVEPGTTGREKVEGNVAAGEAAAAPERAGEEKDPNVSKATVVPLVVGSTLELARETPPLLVRALAALTGEGAMLPESNCERGGVGEHIQGKDAATASRDECLTSPDATTPVSGPLVEEEAVLTAQHRQPRWVFTGVIEALVLAESFRATTTLHGLSPQPEKKSGNFYDRDCGRKHLSATSSSAASSPSFAHAGGGGTKAGEQGGGENRPSTGGEPPPHTAAEWKNSPSATTCRPQNTGGVDDLQHFLLVERQLEMLHREAFLQVNTGDDGLSTPTTFVLPFSWGSMSLLNATAPLVEKRRGAFDDGSHDRLQDLQNIRRRAAQLDRLLSARIVRALPGYVISLPPRRCIGIMPSLLRWLEVGAVDAFVEEQDTSSPTYVQYVVFTHTNTNHEKLGYTNTYFAHSLQQLLPTDIDTI